MTDESVPNAPPEAYPVRHSHPYRDAARLPEGETVDVKSLVHGDWIELEVGPGRGGFMFERAAAEPKLGMIGLEIRLKWAAIVDGRLGKAGLGPRARVFAEDAKSALLRLGPPGSVERIYLHFPDPWWKKRHTKRLVMGDVFLDGVARLLSPKGELVIQTDVAERADEYESHLLSDTRFVAAGDQAGSARMAENPYSARSPREHRAIKDGLPVYRMRFRLAPPV